ncbi:MAG: J domain-containing protein [Spirochaetales bacterium]|nr:J domain-containing protein [Spirochaetales bacterium]
MFDSASENEGALALEKIFGPRHGYRFRSRLPGLDELKKAFRLQSLRLHPDRARALGRAEELLTREFQSVNNAYRLLLPIIARQGRRPASAAAPRSPGARRDFYWKLKRLPPIRLRFAQFLYYRGLIGFNTLIRAIVWQTERRPRAGELALERRELTREQINIVLRRKQVREPFLRAAVRLGFLDDAARRRIIDAQKAFGLPIGRFFIEEEILTPERLAALLAECARHNQSIRS